MVEEWPVRIAPEKVRELEAVSLSQAREFRFFSVMGESAGTFFPKKKVVE